MEGDDQMQLDYYVVDLNATPNTPQQQPDISSTPADGGRVDDNDDEAGGEYDDEAEEDIDSDAIQDDYGNDSESSSPEGSVDEMADRVGGVHHILVLLQEYKLQNKGGQDIARAHLATRADVHAVLRLPRDPDGVLRLKLPVNQPRRQNNGPGPIQPQHMRPGRRRQQLQITPAARTNGSSSDVTVSSDASPEDSDHDRAFGPPWKKALRVAPPVPELARPRCPAALIGKLRVHSRYRLPGLLIDTNGQIFRNKWVRSCDVSDAEARFCRSRGDPVFLQIFLPSDGGAPAFNRIDALNLTVDTDHIELTPGLSLDVTELNLARQFLTERMRRLTQYHTELDQFNARCNLYRTCFPPAAMRINNVLTREDAEQRITDAIRAANQKVEDQHRSAEETDTDRLYNGRRHEMHELRDVFLRLDRFRDMATQIPVPPPVSLTDDWPDHRLIRSCIPEVRQQELINARNEPRAMQRAHMASRNGSMHGLAIKEKVLAEQFFMVGWGRRDIIQNAPHLLSRVAWIFWWV